MGLTSTLIVLRRAIEKVYFANNNNKERTKAEKLKMYRQIDACSFQHSCNKDGCTSVDNFAPHFGILEQMHLQFPKHSALYAVHCMSRHLL